jgi:S-adenosylmethionine decarboxylase
MEIGMTTLQDHRQVSAFSPAAGGGCFVNPNNTRHFGEHVMIDGYGGSSARLDDRHLVLDCLNQLPRKLLMVPLSQPEIYFAAGGGPKDPGGWTGFVVVQESHISIHTFPANRFVSIDVYTCKNGLDVGAISQYFTERFELATLETNYVRRGTRFHQLALAPFGRQAPQ